MLCFSVSNGLCDFISFNHFVIIYILFLLAILNALWTEKDEEEEVEKEDIQNTRDLLNVN